MKQFFYQQEITLDVLKKYVCENKSAVISGLAKDVSQKNRKL